VEVQITTSPNDYNFRDSNADLAIYFGHGNWAGTQSQRLFPEIVIPVCNQKIKQEMASVSTPNLCWIIPAEAAGIPAPALDDVGRLVPPASGIRAKSCRLPDLQRLFPGDPGGAGRPGIALGWQPLIAPFLASKQLVQCGPMHRTERGYYLISANAKPVSAQQEKVKAWLLDEAWSFHASGHLIPENK
jgi:hypothetical protein